MLYLLHFSNKYKRKRHYLGFTANTGTLATRLKDHKWGRGAKLLEAVHKAGISFEVVRTWPDGIRDDETAFKRRKKAYDRSCPKCTGLSVDELQIREQLRTKQEQGPQISPPQPAPDKQPMFVIPVEKYRQDLSLYHGSTIFPREDQTFSEKGIVLPVRPEPPKKELPAWLKESLEDPNFKRKMFERRLAMCDRKPEPEVWIFPIPY